MATYVECLAGEQLVLRLVKGKVKKKLSLADPRGKLTSIAPDKVLFSHNGNDFEQVTARIEALRDELDVELLWETAVEELGGGPHLAKPLAELYFGETGPAHCSAVFHALNAERDHFRRRRTGFVPRTAEELSNLREQRAAEQRAAAEFEALERALDTTLSPELAGRLERFVRAGGDDRLLTRALERRSNDPAKEAFLLLFNGGHLPPTCQLEVLQADLREGHPEPVLAHAASVIAPPPGQVQPALFSIDDPDTREVDDVLSVSRDGHLLRVDIDIADVGSVVLPGDPVDSEAKRRATTVYLPTGVYYMLPEKISCEIASLHEGKPRRALRHSVWLDDEGEVKGFEMSRVDIRVGQRLDYDRADRLLAEPQDGDDRATAEALGLLHGLAGKLAQRRRERGALFLQRREWKLRVHDDGATIKVFPLAPDSPSRALVAEMMILANSLSAEEAADQGLPIIYRTQPSPDEPVPEVDMASPAAFDTLRRFIKPAALSLNPAEHWGLGLTAYTQVTSPLRRYADLVVQRQLCAMVEERRPPCAQEELLKVLATAEATEKEAKRVEAAVNERWALEVVRRMEQRNELDAVVLGEHPAGGHKVQLQSCGAIGILADDRRHEPGSHLPVNVKTVKPTRGILRFTPAT